MCSGVVKARVAHVKMEAEESEIQNKDRRMIWENWIASLKTK
jgi:hypothetical protein